MGSGCPTYKIKSRSICQARNWPQWFTQKKSSQIAKSWNLSSSPTTNTDGKDHISSWNTLILWTHPVGYFLMITSSDSFPVISDYYFMIGTLRCSLRWKGKTGLDQGFSKCHHSKQDAEVLQKPPFENIKSAHKMKTANLKYLKLISVKYSIILIQIKKKKCNTLQYALLDSPVQKHVFA